MFAITPLNLVNKSLYPYKTPLKSKEAPFQKADTRSAQLLPAAFYISFGAYNNDDFTLKGQIAKLSLEQYPSQRIADLAKQILKECPNTKKTIYHVHNEYYAPLLACETLDEAKALYPEFQNVIDASTLTINSDSPLALKKIKRGEVKGVTIQNASLMFLKQYYGKMGSPKKKEDFFGFGPTACYAVFDILNIEKPNPYYVRLYATSKPNYRDTISEKRTKVAATEECKKNASKGQKRRWEREDGARQTASDTQKRIWAKLSEQEKQARIDKINDTTHTPEYQKEASRRSKELWDNPDYRAMVMEKQRIFYDTTPEFRELKSKAWHMYPEILQVMSDTLKDFPHARYIIAKVHSGVPLTEGETKTYKLYLAECKKRCPDMYKTVNQTFSKLWQQFKQEKERQQGEN